MSTLQDLSIFHNHYVGSLFPVKRNLKKAKHIYFRSHSAHRHCMSIPHNSVRCLCLLHCTWTAIDADQCEYRKCKREMQRFPRMVTSIAPDNTFRARGARTKMNRRSLCTFLMCASFPIPRFMPRIMHGVWTGTAWVTLRRHRFLWCVWFLLCTSL